MKPGCSCTSTADRRCLDHRSGRLLGGLVREVSDFSVSGGSDAGDPQGGAASAAPSKEAEPADPPDEPEDEKVRFEAVCTAGFNAPTP